MGLDSKIQWTEHTWNPWHGCRKVSPGCKFCYMYRDKDRYGQDPTVVLRSKGKFREPLKWKDPALVFTCSWSDWFIEEADVWRDEAWQIVKTTPHLTYQILTKRPERIPECLPADWGEGYANVWLGVSVENNAVLHRVTDLIYTPAVVRFLSVEPMIGPVSLDGTWGYSGSATREMIDAWPIDWVIIGGESGNDHGKYRYRPCEIEWIEDLIHECRAVEVPVFVKQLGTHLANTLRLRDRHGGTIEEWPEQLRVREMPETREYSPSLF